MRLGKIYTTITYIPPHICINISMIRVTLVCISVLEVMLLIYTQTRGSLDDLHQSRVPQVGCV